LRKIRETRLAFRNLKRHEGGETKIEGPSEPYWYPRGVISVRCANASLAATNASLANSAVDGLHLVQKLSISAICRIAAERDAALPSARREGMNAAVTTLI
jgi:hypothetical protein